MTLTGVSCFSAPYQFPSSKISVSSRKSGPRVYSVRSTIRNLSKLEEKSDIQANSCLKVGDKILVFKREKNTPEPAKTQSKTQNRIKTQKKKGGKVMKLSDLPALPSGEFDAILTEQEPQVPQKIRVK